jgi:hypothetical protein
MADEENDNGLPTIRSIRVIHSPVLVGHWSNLLFEVDEKLLSASKSIWAVNVESLNLPSFP